MIDILGLSIFPCLAMALKQLLVDNEVYLRSYGFSHYYAESKQSFKYLQYSKPEYYAQSYKI